MSPRTNKAGAARSMAGPRGMRATPKLMPAQSGRRGLRLDQDSRRRRQAALPWTGPQQALVRADRSRLQPHPPRQHRGDRCVAERRSRGLRHRIQRSRSRPFTYCTCVRSLLSVRPLVADGQLGTCYPWFSSLLETLEILRVSGSLVLARYRFVAGPALDAGYPLTRIMNRLSV